MSVSVGTLARPEDNISEADWRLTFSSYVEVDVIHIGYTSLSNHGRLAGCGSREEISTNHRGVDLLTQIDPSGLWHEELLHLTAQTDDHEDFLGQRIVGGDSRLVASFRFPFWREHDDSIQFSVVHRCWS